MVRSFIMALLLSPFVFAAPALKPKLLLYYPTQVGDSRVYEMRIPGSSSEFRDIVTKVEEKGTAYRVTLSRISGDTSFVMGEVEVSDKGLYRLSSGDVKFTPPLPVIKLPMKVGDTWENDPDSYQGGFTIKTKYTIAKEEEVEVPAGKFKAIRLDAEFKSGDDTVRSSSWYAPRVGLVKVKSLRGETETIQVLKSFSAGKGK